MSARRQASAGVSAILTESTHEYHADDVRAKAAAKTLLPVEDIHRAKVERLLVAQRVLGHGLELGYWETSDENIGKSQGAQHLRVDLRQRAISFLPEKLASLLLSTKPAKAGERQRISRLVEDAMVPATRYLLLLRYGPAGMKKQASNQPLDTGNIAQFAYIYLPVLIANAVKARFAKPLERGELKLFETFAPGDISERPRHVRERLQVECERANRLAARSLWTDVPPSSERRKTMNPRGAATRPEPAPTIDPHQPLPDEYMEELGKNARWLVENVGPSLLRLLGKLKKLWEKRKKRRVSDPTFSRWVKEALADFRWLDAAGAPIERLPCDLKFIPVGKRKSTSDSLSWPPTLQSEVFYLSGQLQAAHCILTLLVLGSRVGEFLSFERGCVTRKSDGKQYADGRTFKFAQPPSGEKRDWVLPDFVMLCLEQQTRLIRASELVPSSSTRVKKRSKKRPVNEGQRSHLWGSITAGVRQRGAPMGTAQVNNSLKAFARAFRMSESPGGQELTSHRFRKTLARIVALAIANSPKILMDVFGHKDIEMTLYYILHDKNLAAEIEVVERELRVMRASEAVADMVAIEQEIDARIKRGESVDDLESEAHLRGYGGKYAPALRRTVREALEEVHRSGRDWDAADTRDLALILTMNGTFWQLVRPGVICTKTFGQAGPCNKSVGYPQPDRCQSACGHRLEEDWLRRDVDESIAESLRFYREEGLRGNDLVQSFWANQVLGHLTRFPDLHKKWMQDETVKEIVRQREKSHDEEGVPA